MFYKVQPTLSVALSTGGTLVLTDVDAYRFKIDGPHSITVNGILYRSPGDFTVSVDGGNKATIKWLDAATLAIGAKPYIALGMIDTLTDEASSGSAATDSSGDALPANFNSLTVVKNVDAVTGFPTSLRKTNGTVTMVGDVPTITPGTETVAYVTAILTYSNGQVASQGEWVNQYA